MENKMTKPIIGIVGSLYKESRESFLGNWFWEKSLLRLLYDNKKDLADLYFYRTARSILMFGQLFYWLGVLPLNKIFYFAC